MGGQIEARLEFARDVAVEAGALALRRFRELETLEVEHKGAHDVVSAADREVEGLIHDAIAARWPDDGFLGEEGGARSLSDGAPIWVVDPIDGTQCFLAGVPTWCVSIGLVEGGAIAGGVIHDPNAGETFRAMAGRGATCNARPIRATDAADLGAGMTEVGHSTRIPVEPTVRFVEGLLNAGGIYHRGGSGALALAYVAAGRYLAYFEGHMNVWDACAGAALVSAAGGWVNDILADDGLAHGSVVVASGPRLETSIRAIAADAGYRL